MNFTTHISGCTLPTEVAGLLGTDFLNKTRAEIDLECGKVTLTSIDDAPRVYSVTHTKSAVLTVFTGEKANRSLQPTRIEETRLDEQHPAYPRSEMATPRSKSWLVRATENITVAPRCRQVVVAKIGLEKGQKPPTTLRRTGSNPYTRSTYCPCSLAS
jgi:hypothetical protein